ncbi:hypothetical protein [Ottowia thiooxydans]|uniref:hypothetical protein n=1 Tax=Ottowia thiooxydans TaxID=219182 RepID=UPI0012EC61ED|nr:hypothetical protein [Ottowia thiooxydans]
MPPNRLCLIGQPPSSQTCRRHVGALAARRWFRRIPLPFGRCSSFPKFIAFSRDRSPQCLAVKARRAVSSPSAAGRTNPALLP